MSSLRLDTTISKMNEKLINATMERLDEDMERFPEFEKLMSTPIGELDERYLNLAGVEIQEMVSRFTLYEVIQEVFNNRIFTGNIFFSEEESGSKRLTGLAMYSTTIYNNKVTDLGIISFRLDKAPKTYFDDLRVLIETLLSKYESISFEVNESSFADSLYVRVLDRFGFGYERFCRNGLSYYRIDSVIR